jgi:hypothetical protein
MLVTRSGGGEVLERNTLESVTTPKIRGMRGIFFTGDISLIFFPRFNAFSL